jgi:transposase
MDRFVAQTFKKTIVILDNSPIHKSKRFLVKIEKWRKKDVSTYILPQYFPKLTLIEILWRIKYN